MVIGGEDLGFFRNSAGGNDAIGEGKNSSFSVKLPRLIPCRDRGESVAHEVEKRLQLSSGLEGFDATQDLGFDHSPDYEVGRVIAGEEFPDVIATVFYVFHKGIGIDENGFRFHFFFLGEWLEDSSGTMMASGE